MDIFSEKLIIAQILTLQKIFCRIICTPPSILLIRSTYVHTICNVIYLFNYTLSYLFISPLSHLMCLLPIILLELPAFLADRSNLASYPRYSEGIWPE